MSVNKITVPAKIDYMEKVLLFIDSELDKFSCSKKARSQIKIAVDEIFTNIANYAYFPQIGDTTICVNIEGDPLSAKIEFIDSGHPYNPFIKADPDISLSTDEREIGGLGIYIVKKIMDSVDYFYEDNKNMVTINKLL